MSLQMHSYVDIISHLKDSWLNLIPIAHILEDIKQRCCRRNSLSV